MAQELVERDAEELVEGRPLSPREELFCRFYGDPESPHYSRPTAAATAAGYAEKTAWNSAWKLRRRSHVQARLAVFQKAAFAAAGKVLSDLENTRLLALAKSDLAVAARCSELQGKHLAMFTDKVAVDDPAGRFEYDAREAIEARRITRFLLENPSLDEPLALPAPKPAIVEQPAPPVRATPEMFAAIEQARTPDKKASCDL